MVREPQRLKIAVPILTAFADIKLNRQLDLPDWAGRPYQLCNRAISPYLRSPSAARGRRCPRGDPANDVFRISSIAAAKRGARPVFVSLVRSLVFRLAVASELGREQIMGGLPDEIPDPDDRREFVRTMVYRSALLSIPGQITAQPCSMRDFTVKGVSIRLSGITLLPLEFQISFDEFRTCEACRLVWRDGDFAGLLFESRLHRFEA